MFSDIGCDEEEWLEGNLTEQLPLGIESEGIPSSSLVSADNDHLHVSAVPEQPAAAEIDPSSHPPLPSVSPLETATLHEQQEFLQGIVNSVTGKFPELAFTLRYDGLNCTNPVLEISQRAMFNHPPLGLTSRICVTIQNKHYKNLVMMRLWSEVEIKSADDVKDLCFSFCKRSPYKFCPGIDPVHYENEYHQAIRFHIKSVRQLEFPFSRVDSVNCKLWFLPASNCKVAEKAASEMRCTPCKRLVHDLNL